MEILLNSENSSCTGNYRIYEMPFNYLLANGGNGFLGELEVYIFRLYGFSILNDITESCFSQEMGFDILPSDDDIADFLTESLTPDNRLTNFALFNPWVLPTLDRAIFILNNF